MKEYGIKDTSDKAKKQQEQKEKASVTQDGTCKTCGQQKEASNPAWWKQAFTHWIIRHNISFSTAAASDTTSLPSYCAQGVLCNLIPKSVSTVSDWVLDSYNKRLPTITAKLDKAQSVINISIDSWKSSNDNNFDAVVAHITNENFEQDRVLIGFPKVQGPKSGANQAYHIARVLSTFAVTASNLGVVTAVSASDNDTCLKSLEVLLMMPDGWSLSHRIRCIGHIINLVVKALLFGAEEARIQKALNAAGDDEQMALWAQLGIIGRLRNLCIFINRSLERKASFRALQSAIQPELTVIYALLVDGGIRWHATYEMIDRAILLKETLLKWQRQRKQGSGVDISSNFHFLEDFKALGLWQSVLHDLKEYCIAKEYNATTNTYGTIAGVVKTITAISERLDIAEEEIKGLNLPAHYAEPLLTGITAAIAKNDSYCHKLDDSKLYYAAIILNPNYRLLWFESYWAAWENKKYYNNAKRGMEALYNSYRDAHLFSQTLEPSQSLLQSQNSLTAIQPSIDSSLVKEALILRQIRLYLRRHYQQEAQGFSNQRRRIPTLQQVL